MPSLCAAFSPRAACWRISATSAHGKRTPPREGLAEGFAFQKLHGDVGRAVIGLAGFVNGDDVRVMNAPRGSRFILKAQQEVGVIQQLAVQDLERHRTVAHRDLLGEEDRTHAARSQLADQPETARKTRSEIGRRSQSQRQIPSAAVVGLRLFDGSRVYKPRSLSTTPRPVMSDQ